MPTASRATSRRRRSSLRSATAPTRSNPSKPAATSSYERVQDYWAKDLPVMKGQFNFDAFELHLLSRPHAGLRGLQSRASIDYLGRKRRQRTGQRKYDFDAIKKGLVKKEAIPIERVAPMQAFVFNHAPQAVRGSARAPGLVAAARLRGSQQEAVLRPLRARRQLFREFGTASARGCRKAANWRSSTR